MADHIDFRSAYAQCLCASSFDQNWNLCADIYVKLYIDIYIFYPPTTIISKYFVHSSTTNVLDSHSINILHHIHTFALHSPTKHIRQITNTIYIYERNHFSFQSKHQVKRCVCVCFFICTKNEIRFNFYCFCFLVFFFVSRIITYKLHFCWQCL